MFQYDRSTAYYAQLVGRRATSRSEKREGWWLVKWLGVSGKASNKVLCFCVCWLLGAGRLILYVVERPV